MTAPATARFNRIAEQGLCIGCGLCQALAGPDVIRMMKVASGFERPVVLADPGEATVDRIYDICPGTRVDGLPEAEVDATTRIDPVWGPWRRMVEAWAGDPELRFEGSTGGVLTALAEFLLRSGRVGFVLHVRASSTEPGFGEPTLSFGRADVLRAAGSRYGPTAPLIDIGAALDRAEPFAFIGKPCDVGALRNLARFDPRVDELVRYMLTPVCGGFMAPAAQRSFMESRGIDPRRITAIRYRGRGCPGPTRVETADGIHEFHYLDFWGEDDSAWHLPFRCKICPDGIGEAADIAAADAWPGGAPDRRLSETDPGTNAVIVRSARGQELFEAALRDGALVAGAEVTPAQMGDYQPHQVRKKQVAFARHQGLRDEGRLAPATRRLRIESLTADLPDAVREAQRSGTRQRVRTGKAAEPTPRQPGTED